MPSRVAPRPFRARLTLAFVAVAGITCGLMALGTFVGVREYRFAQEVQEAQRQARLVRLQVAPGLSLADFDELVGEFRQRAGFETLVLTADTSFTSLVGLGVEDVPAELRGREPGETAAARTSVAGRPFLVAGGRTVTGTGEVYLFFDRADVLDSVRDLGVALTIGWVSAVLLAAASGRAVARRTLRPVKAASEAARAVTGGLVQTRLDHGGDDEFGDWADSFNEMVTALQDKIEELSRAAQRERQFTSDVAHELRTPLAGMSASAALLSTELDGLEDRTRQPAQLLVADVERLQALVLELLELARFDAGQEGLLSEPLAVRDVVEAVVRPWGDGGQLRVVVSGDPWIAGDRSRMRRALGNLVGNALQHGRQGVEVHAEQVGDEVRIDVLDRGPGVPLDDLPRLFDRFFKSDRSRGQGGSGLGLAIARENARIQGGRIEAANRPDGGACFTLWLPAADPETDDPETEDDGSGDPESGDDEVVVGDQPPSKR